MINTTYNKKKFLIKKIEKHNRCQIKRNLVASRQRKAKKDLYDAFLNKIKIT